jgi:hypothetical protein
VVWLKDAGRDGVDITIELIIADAFGELYRRRKRVRETKDLRCGQGGLPDHNVKHSVPEGDQTELALGGYPDFEVVARAVRDRPDRHQSS